MAPDGFWSAVAGTPLWVPAKPFLQACGPQAEALRGKPESAHGGSHPLVGGGAAALQKPPCETRTAVASIFRVFRVFRGFRGFRHRCQAKRL